VNGGWEKPSDDGDRETANDAGNEKSPPRGKSGSGRGGIFRSCGPGRYRSRNARLRLRLHLRIHLRLHRRTTLVGVRTGAGEGCVSDGDEEANETAACALVSATGDGEGCASDDGDPEIGSDGERET